MTKTYKICRILTVLIRTEWWWLLLLIYGPTPVQPIYGPWALLDYPTGMYTCREPRSGGVYACMGASREIWPDISGLKWAMPSWSGPWQCHGTNPAAFNIYALNKIHNSRVQPCSRPYVSRPYVTIPLLSNLN